MRSTVLIGRQKFGKVLNHPLRNDVPGYQLGAYAAALCGFPVTLSRNWPVRIDGARPWVDDACAETRTLCIAVEAVTCQRQDELAGLSPGEFIAFPISLFGKSAAHRRSAVRSAYDGGAASRPNIQYSAKVTRTEPTKTIGVEVKYARSSSSADNFFRKM
jgi:hypothetical protein